MCFIARSMNFPVHHEPTVAVSVERAEAHGHHLSSRQIGVAGVAVVVVEDRPRVDAHVVHVAVGAVLAHAAAVSEAGRDEERISLARQAYYTIRDRILRGEIALGLVYVIASVLVSAIALFAGLVLVRGA